MFVVQGRTKERQNEVMVINHDTQKDELYI